MSRPPLVRATRRSRKSFDAVNERTHAVSVDAAQASSSKRSTSHGVTEVGGAAKKLRTGAASASVTAESPSSGGAPEAVQQQQDAASVRLTVCRDGAVLVARVALATEDGLGTDCLVHFCGAQVQVCCVFATLVNARWQASVEIALMHVHKTCCQP